MNDLVRWKESPWCKPLMLGGAKRAGSLTPVMTSHASSLFRRSLVIYEIYFHYITHKMSKTCTLAGVPRTLGGARWQGMSFIVCRCIEFSRIGGAAPRRCATAATVIRVKAKGARMAKLDYGAMSWEILAHIGGKENLTSVNHCATRLRLGLKDTSLVDKAALQRIDGVLGVEVMDTQIQVIVGQVIEDLCFAFERETGMSGSLVDDDGNEIPKERKTPLSVFVDFLQLMAKIMSPVIPALICAGFFSLILTLGTMFWGFQKSDSTYIILNSLAQSAFYFLPMFVAYTAAKNFEVEVPLALLLAGFLLYPDWVGLVAAGSESGFTSYFGIPVLLTTYNGSVLQIILSIWVMGKVSKWLTKVIPTTVRYFLKPVLLVLVMSIITLSLTGPLGGLVTNYISAGIDFVRDTVPWLTVPAIYIFSGTLGVFMPGFHLALIPIATQNFATLGYDDIINIWFFSGTTVPGFVALWTFFKVRNLKAKNIALPAAISALFGGISEPTTYGICYKVPKLYFVNFITGAALAIYNGIVGTKAYAYGAYYLTNLLLFYSPDDSGNLTKAIIGVVIVAVVSFVGVFFTKWEWPEDDDETAKVEHASLIPGFGKAKA